MRTLVPLAVLALGLSACNPAGWSKRPDTAESNPAESTKHLDAESMQLASKCTDDGWKSWEHWSRKVFPSRTVKYTPQFNITDGRCLMLASYLDGFRQRIHYELVDVYSNRVVNYGAFDVYIDYDTFLEISKNILAHPHDYEGGAWIRLDNGEPMYIKQEEAGKP